jgi:squalene synthase HpnC
VTLTSSLPLQLILNRAAIGIVTRDQPGVIAAVPAANEPAGAGTWESESVARTASQVTEENFPVALRFLPERHRRHLLAVYAYARTVDDTGDLAPGERPKMLADLAEDVHRLYGAGPAGGSADGAGPRAAAVRGLAATVTECAIPMQPFLDLIAANQQDQVVSRYATFADLAGYCRLSANPVGQMVLYIFGSYTPERARRSDDICTGLQLAEHWQDVAEDMRAGRIYLPAEDMRRFGCREEDLRASRAPTALRNLLAFEVGRAGELIDSGAPLIGDLGLVPRAAVAGFVAGGRAALAAIAKADYDVLRTTPRPGKVRTLAGLVLAFARGR